MATWKPRHKCKASHTMAADRCINCKVTIRSNDGSNGSEESNYNLEVADHPATSQAGDTELGKDSNIGYFSTKAMGDADCEVSFYPSLLRLNVLTLIRPLPCMSRLIVLLTFAPSSLKTTNI